MNLQENKFFVYALVDPINKVPFYIGKGCDDRPYHHLRKNSKELNISKVNYIKNIRLLGLEPTVHYISINLTERDAYNLELVCIKHSKNIGLPITNKTGLRAPPSRKGKTMPLEARRKISEFQKGRSKSPMSAETKLKISLALKGRPNPKRLMIEKNILMDLYLLQNKSKREIATLYGVSFEPINRLLKEYGIRKISK